MSRNVKNNDNWLIDLAYNLDKQAVQPVRDSFFNQINTIMNGGMTSKFSTVEEVVEDMKARSGLTAMMSKVSEKEEDLINKKTANSNSNKISEILNTVCNIITSSKGNLPVPAIIDKVKFIHQDDIDNNFFDDDRFINFVSKKNLKEKSNYNDVDNYSNLGKQDFNNEDENQPWNLDAFHGIDA